jgi:hypothetical protein
MDVKSFSKMKWSKTLLRLGVVWASLAACLLMAATSTPDKNLRRDRLPYDASDDTPKFQFARLRYPGGIPNHIKNWYTDYPEMDNNFTSLAQRLTGIDLAEPVIVDASSPRIFKYPFIYTVEPGQMILGESEAANLREYLTRGGLWFADDFHGDEEFRQFLEQIYRVLPEATLVELNTSHPLFHCFYQIDEIIQVTNDGIAKCRSCEQWENGPTGKDPKVFAIVDGRGRINVLMAWNTDLGDGLEWADDPEYPSKYSAYAFKLVMNLIVYATTH